MKWWDFNLAEIRGLFVLLVFLLVGSGIAIYKKYHTDFPVEIVFKESKAGLAQEKPAKPIEHIQPKIVSPALAKKMDLNTASWAELDFLPHIGPTLSKRIVEYREKNGKFKQVDDLLKVNGIGKKTLEKIKEYVEVK
ncbi:MAG: helix-hairpin-helix domain-containing protein [candidate division Zixibacteria bacterium]|nr:helix-hairpin-helix domain-containing protein [candidate division Zixibacteria bacterium]